MLNLRQLCGVTGAEARENAGICPVFVWDLSGICPGFCRDFSCLCPEPYAGTLLGKSRRT